MSIARISLTSPFGPKNSDHVVGWWPLSAPQPHGPHYFLSKPIEGHRASPALPSPTGYATDSVTAAAHIVLISLLTLMLHHSGTGAAMLIFRPRLHLTAQNWPKCKILCKNGVGWVGVVLIIYLLQHKLSMPAAVRVCVFQSTSKQPIEARRCQIKPSIHT